ERTYRMPKNAPALSDAQIDLIHRWVEEGTTWHVVTKKIADADAPYWLLLLNYFVAMADKYKFEIEYTRPFLIAFAVAQVLLLVVGRLKRAYLAERPWTRGKARWLCAFCSRITSGEMVLAWLLMIGGLAIVAQHANQLRTANELAQARTKS